MKQETETDFPLPRRPDKVPWWKKLFRLEPEEISFAGGRNTAGHHDLAQSDQPDIQEDVGLINDKTITRKQNFGHPDFET